MNKLIRFWFDLRASFWFLPSLMVSLSIALALVLIAIDSAHFSQHLKQWPRMFGVGAEGARQMLGTLAGSMMTVMGISFSMTLLALVQASTQYTSRVLRTFMRSRVTQTTLGVFASIFVYCLIVLRTIRGTAGVDEFVPSLAVFIAFIMSLIGVAVLIYFIHHIASSIQASSIIASVAKETYAAIDVLLPHALCPTLGKQHNLEVILAEHDKRSWYPIAAHKSGYIQSINHAELLKLAEDNKTIVKMEHAIGAFAVKDTALVSLALTFAPTQKTIAAFNQAYSISRHRTVAQDPAFGIRQIVDIALKALSPGVNDTSTAVMCIDYLTSIMARLVNRQFPPRYRYEQQTLRVVAIEPSFEGLLVEAFEQIRTNAITNVAILARLLSALETIGSLTTTPSQFHALNEQLHCLDELIERNIKSSHDSTRLKNRLTAVAKTLKPH